ncbi:hypothetical protein ACWGKW_27580 [Streptomyces sp. NPDC054766]
MKRMEDDGQDVPQEHGFLNAAQAAGLAAVMQQLDSRSAAERAELANEAEGAVLGYEAYGLGHEYLERGTYNKARHWLQVAARHGVPGAEEALAETDAREIGSFALSVVQARGSLIPRGADGVTPRGAFGRPPGTAGEDGMPAAGDIGDVFTRGLEPVSVDHVALARAEAALIAEQTRRTAAGILNEARRQAEDDLRAAVRTAQQVRDDVRAAVRLAEQARRMVFELQRQIEELRAALQEESQLQAGAQSSLGNVVVSHRPLQFKRFPTPDYDLHVSMAALHCQVTLPDRWRAANEDPSALGHSLLLRPLRARLQEPTELPALVPLDPDDSASLPQVHAPMPILCHRIDGVNRWYFSDSMALTIVLSTAAFLRIEAPTKTESEAGQDSAEPEGVGVEKAGHATCL